MQYACGAKEFVWEVLIQILRSIFGQKWLATNARVLVHAENYVAPVKATFWSFLRVLLDLVLTYVCRETLHQQKDTFERLFCAKMWYDYKRKGIIQRIWTIIVSQWMSTWSAIINNHLLHDTCEYISAAGSVHEWVANEWMLQTKPRQLYPRLSRALRWVHDRKFSCSVNFFARSLLFVGLDVIFLKMVFPWLNALLYTLVKGVSVRTTVNSFLATLNINLSKQHKSYGYYLM